MSSKVNLLSVLYDVLAILGKMFGKSLTSAWIFQHAKINGMDTDKRDELAKMFDKLGNKSLKAVYQLDSADKLFTVKQWTMIAMIARGAKSSDFTDDRATQALIDSLVKVVNTQYKFDRADVPTKAEKTSGKSKTSPRVITVK